MMKNNKGEGRGDLVFECPECQNTDLGCSVEISQSYDVVMEKDGSVSLQMSVEDYSGTGSCGNYGMEEEYEFVCTECGETYYTGTKGGLEDKLREDMGKKIYVEYEDGYYQCAWCGHILDKIVEKGDVTMDLIHEAENGEVGVHEHVDHDVPHAAGEYACPECGELLGVPVDEDMVYRIIKHNNGITKDTKVLEEYAESQKKETSCTQ